MSVTRKVLLFAVWLTGATVIQYACDQAFAPAAVTVTEPTTTITIVIDDDPKNEDEAWTRECLDVGNLMPTSFDYHPRCSRRGI